MKSWRLVVRGAVFTAAALALAGCAERAHHLATAPAAVTTAQAGSATFNPTHRQYYDQRRKRYYYFDPSRRAYFWEDGTPKS